MKRTARIFEDVDGYHVCDDAADHLMRSDYPHATKADAMRHAAHVGYTHATGSGTYWSGVQRITVFKEWMDAGRCA